jgi:hypothetical protein
VERHVSFSALARELERDFEASRDDMSSPWPEPRFATLALAAFRLQFETIPAYRGLCERRGLTPETVTRWEDVPAVPATAFKHLDLTVEPGRRPEAVFRTSGTSRGRGTRGRHLVASLSLYRRSLLPTFGAHVLGGERMPFISLVPPWRERIDSSLSFMASAAAEAFASEVLWLVDGRGHLDVDGLFSAMREAAKSGTPVLVVGTSLALHHALERLEDGRRVHLPAGSRVMETGGFKGMASEMTGSELHARIEAATGIPLSMIIGEYGMTELLSQLYEPVLDARVAASGTYVPAPWLRVRAVDPSTLTDVPEGTPGLLTFFDLANAGSICHVLTEDLGTVSRGRVRLQGRVAGAEPRGCSIAMDELLSAAAAAAPDTDGAAAPEWLSR